MNDRFFLHPEAGLSLPRRDIDNAVLFGLVKEALDKGHTATIRAKGNSMRPFIEEKRDLIMVSSVKAEEIKRGDVLLCEIEKERFVLHRVIRREGNDLTLKGDGNWHGTEGCQVENVIGRAVAFYRKGRQKPDLVCGKKWQIYSKVWMALSPMRRLLLAFHRRIYLKLFPLKIISDSPLENPPKTKVCTPSQWQKA